jgi:hypothetical protein
MSDIGDDELADLIVLNATNHYGSDQACPLDWEPSGFDFLSPCLQEADLMSRIAANKQFPDFEMWFQKFLPQFQDEKFVLEPGNYFYLITTPLELYFSQNQYSLNVKKEMLNVQFILPKPRNLTKF